MLSLTLEYHVYPMALRYWIELNWRTTMNTLMNVIIFILFAYYLAALGERMAQPEIIEDGESMGLDQYYESEYLNTRDYYLAADRGFGHESSWDF